MLIALDALAIAPEQFTTESSVYLGLRSIYLAARARQERRPACAMSCSAHVGHGGHARGRQRLRRRGARCAPPQEALRQALERGATDEEIKKLTDELRAALDKFLQALAEQMRKNPQQLARPLDPNARSCGRRICRA